MYKNQVAINGNPTQASAAFSAVFAAALANGGSLDNIAPGIAYFKKLHSAGNFVPVTASAATMESGQTPIVIWWDYLLASEIGPSVPGLKIVIPSDASYAAYYDQAISKYAPDPAAARLWEEYLYSTTGQNLWLAGRGPADRAVDPGEQRHGQPGGLQGAAAGPVRQRHLPHPVTAGGGRGDRRPAVVQRDRLAVDQTVAAPGSLADPGALGPAPAAASGPRGEADRAWRAALAAPDGRDRALRRLRDARPAAADGRGRGRRLPEPNSGGFTLSNVKTATHGVYLHGFEQSIILSVITSIVPGIFGLLIAYAIFTAKRGTVLRQVVITASGVFANFGGVPLAFLFIATLGSSGLATRWLADLGFDPYDHGFSLYTLAA